MSMKLLTSVGVVVANRELVIGSSPTADVSEILTSDTVEVGDVENIGGTADGVAGAAETNLALLLDGSSEGRDGESEDGGVKHVDGFGLVVDWVGGMIVGCG
jgi:hypothetical protein